MRKTHSDTDCLAVDTKVATLERQLAEAWGKLDAVQRAVDSASDSGQYSLALVEIAAVLALDHILPKEGE